MDTERRAVRAVSLALLGRCRAPCRAVATRNGHSAVGGVLKSYVVQEPVGAALLSAVLRRAPQALALMFPAWC